MHELLPQNPISILAHDALGVKLKSCNVFSRQRKNRFISRIRGERIVESEFYGLLAVVSFRRIHLPLDSLKRFGEFFHVLLEDMMTDCLMTETNSENLDIPFLYVYDMFFEIAHFWIFFIQKVSRSWSKYHYIYRVRKV